MKLRRRVANLVGFELRINSGAIKLERQYERFSNASYRGSCLFVLPLFRSERSGHRGRLVCGGNTVSIVSCVGSIVANIPRRSRVSYDSANPISVITPRSGKSELISSWFSIRRLQSEYFFAEFIDYPTRSCVISCSATGFQGVLKRWSTSQCFWTTTRRLSAFWCSSTGAGITYEPHLMLRPRGKQARCITPVAHKLRTGFTPADLGSGLLSFVGYCVANSRR